jgi:hypothetical protein
MPNSLRRLLNEVAVTVAANLANSCTNTMIELNRALKIAMFYSYELHIQRRSRIILNRYYLPRQFLLIQKRSRHRHNLMHTLALKVKMKCQRGSQTDVTAASFAADTHIRRLNSSQT